MGLLEVMQSGDGAGIDFDVDHNSKDNEGHGADELVVQEQSRVKCLFCLFH